MMATSLILRLDNITTHLNLAKSRVSAVLTIMGDRGESGPLSDQLCTALTDLEAAFDILKGRRDA